MIPLCVIDLIDFIDFSFIEAVPVAGSQVGVLYHLNTLNSFGSGRRMFLEVF